MCRVNRPTRALRALLSIPPLSIAVALLIVGCQPMPFKVGPVSKTTVMGPVSCEPTPKVRLGRCVTCMQAACCAEFIACANDAPCPCGMMARFAVAKPAKALEVCGPMNASFSALASCLDASCADECPVDDGRHHHPLIGKRAPEILAEPVGGDGPRTIEQARGKVVIVDFWATWCRPCKESFPKYQKLADSFRGDVVVIAISVDDPDHVTIDKLLAFAKDTGVKFSVLWDKHLRMEARYMMPNGLPTSFVIDRNGTVRSVHLGYDAALQQEIEGLLKFPEQQGLPAP
jgi:thiol-disulfide isomerase/thioredoxin